MYLSVAGYFYDPRMKSYDKKGLFKVVIKVNEVLRSLSDSFNVLRFDRYFTLSICSSNLPVYRHYIVGASNEVPSDRSRECYNECVKRFTDPSEVVLCFDKCSLEGSTTKQEDYEKFLSPRKDIALEDLEFEVPKFRPTESWPHERRSGYERDRFTPPHRKRTRSNDLRSQLSGKMGVFNYEVEKHSKKGEGIKKVDLHKKHLDDIEAEFQDEISRFL
jgi:hypothetical protein